MGGLYYMSSVQSSVMHGGWEVTFAHSTFRNKSMDAWVKVRFGGNFNLNNLLLLIANTWMHSKQVKMNSVTKGGVMGSTLSWAFPCCSIVLVGYICKITLSDLTVLLNILFSDMMFKG